MYRRMAEDKERGVGEAAQAAAASGEVSLPSAPAIEAIRIQEGAVVVELEPGALSCFGCEFLVMRREMMGNSGAVQERRLSWETRHWTDTAAEPGKSYWYRVVAVDQDGRRSVPSVSRWIRVPDR